MGWREKWAIETQLPSWSPPEAIIKYFPSGSTGFDKEGSPGLYSYLFIQTILKTYKFKHIVNFSHNCTIWRFGFMGITARCIQERYDKNDHQSFGRVFKTSK